MPEHMPFDATIVDKSTSSGFQFEFQCLRCGTGYSSHVQALSSLAADAGGAALKKAGGLLGQRAGKMFGGGVGEFVADHAADFVADRAADAVKDQAKDRALQSAAQEVARQFIRCPSCRRWVCRPRCFTDAAGLCQDCAQGSMARPPAPLPGSMARPPAPLPSAAAPSPQPMYSPPPQPMYSPPPGQSPYPAHAVPSPSGQGSAAPPSQSVYPEYAPPSRPVSSGYLPRPPLQVHVHPSRSHPGRVSLVVADADDNVIAAMRLGLDDVQALADDLLAAADMAMQHADAAPSPTWRHTRGTQPY